MTSILLPLFFQELEGLENRQCSYIEQAVTLANEQDAHLIISVKCEEIRINASCLDAIWEKVQAFLGAIYVVQLNKSYQADKPLFNCNVVFQDICGYTVYLEPYITAVCVPDRGKKNLYPHRKENTTHLEFEP